MPNNWDWTGAGQGAMGGAATGASVGGPWGALIGGLGGGVLGGLMPGGDKDDEYKKRLDEYYNRVLNRGSPQRGPAAQSAVSGFRENQSGLISRLEAMSQGKGPSLATEQLRQATDRNMAQQSSIAQSGRGNAALASMMAANNSARLGQQAAGDSVTARIAEQQMAMRELGQNINAGRQSDEGNSQYNASQQNYRDKDNQEARLRLMGYNDQAIQAILGLNERNAAQPSLMEQLMGGGAGALALGASNKGQSSRQMSPIASGNPGAGGYYTPQRP